MKITKEQRNEAIRQISKNLDNLTDEQLVKIVRIVSKNLKENFFKNFKDIFEFIENQFTEEEKEKLQRMWDKIKEDYQ